MKKVILPIVIITVALTLTGMITWQKRQPAKKKIPETTLLVDTLKLESHDVQFMISSQGNISPRTETILISEISAPVLEVSPNFIAGGFFQKSEVLLTLDPSDYEATVEQARAKLISMKVKLVQEQARSEQAKKEWDMSGLSREKAPSIALRTPYLEEAEANILFAEADLKKAKRKLERTKIRAPYDGLVKKKLVDIGQYVRVGSQLGQTFAVDFAEVRLPLTDQDIAFLDLPTPRDAVQTDMPRGPKVELTSIIGGLPYHWYAYIVRTEGVIDKRSRVRYAVVRITDPYGLDNDSTRPPLSIGSFVTAKIHGNTVNNVFTVPREFVRDSNTLNVMDQENRLRIRKVTIVRAADFVYITKGLNNNEYLITSAIEAPVEGMRLRRKAAM